MGLNNFQRSTWLFTKDGDEQYLYRAVPDHVKPLLDKFIKLDVIPCEPTADITKVGPRECKIYKVSRLPFQIRIHEITRSMALEMVVYLAKLMADCTRHDIALFDINESNVLYWNRPIYVDLDSVRLPSRQTYAGAMARIAYLFNKYVLRKHIHITSGQYNIRHIDKHGGLFVKFRKRWKTIKWSKPAIWEELAECLSGVKIKANQTRWASTYGPHHKNPKKMLEGNAKIRGAMELLKMIDPDTLLDVGCNKGYFCSMASERTQNVVGFDADENCIDIANDMYGENRKVNFANFGMSYLDGRRFSFQRYEADVLVALAVTHHFHSAGFDAAEIAMAMCKLARKWIIIEDIADVKTYHKTFRKAGFELIDTLPSQPKSRQLSLLARNGNA